MDFCVRGQSGLHSEPISQREQNEGEAAVKIGKEEGILVAKELARLHHYRLQQCQPSIAVLEQETSLPWLACVWLLRAGGAFLCIFPHYSRRSLCPLSTLVTWSSLPLFVSVKMYFYSCICVWILTCVQKLTEARRGCWLSWSWSYRQL